MSKQLDLINEILSFWFGDQAQTDLPSDELTNLWFGDDPKTDGKISERFKVITLAAGKGDYDDWQQEPRSSLALILCLDQFPRKIFRDHAEAYAFDSKALAVCQQGLSQEFDHSLSLMERVFYYMPLQHAEDLAIQQQSVTLYHSLYSLSLIETRELYKTFLAFAIKYRDIIQQFGRFPHHNKALGRKSTAKELAFLKA